MTNYQKCPDEDLKMVSYLRVVGEVIQTVIIKIIPVKLGKIIQKDFAQLIDENSLSIGKWGYILFGTCVIQKKK